MNINIDKIKAGEPADVYLFQRLRNGDMAVFGSDMEGISDLVLIGKGQAVFDLLESDEVIRKGLDALDQEIQAVRAEAEVKVNQLKDRKAELLSLTHQK